MVKFDIVSGFLGSGKTTFIKHLLSACTWAGEKIVLIENEFGEVGIDSDILRVEGFEVFEIAHGCVCCTLKGDFIHTLKEILRAKPDRIIFEPSGIFILSEIFRVFQDPEIAAYGYINSITTIVDGMAFPKQIQGFSRFLEDQIAHAGTQVISKTRLLSKEQLAQIQEQLREINPAAPIVDKDWQDFSDPEILLLLDGNLRYGLNSWEDREARQGTNRPGQPPHDHGETHHNHGNADHGDALHGQSEHHHDHSFETVGFRTSKELQPEALTQFLKALSQDEYGKVIRGKGIIKTPDDCLEFNFVDGEFSISPSKVALPGNACFIGTHLEKAKLQAALT